MLSQLFILSSRGDTLVFRDYRGDVVRGTAEIFFRRIKSFKGDQAPPIFNVEGIQFIYVRKPGLFFVCTSKFNICPAFIIELLNRIANLCKDYCGVLNEEAIRCNFTLIYELLDEVLDFGYPQGASTETLKSYIFNEAHLVEANENLSWQATGATVFGAEKLTLPSSASNKSVLSSTKRGGRKNEVFVDMLERLTVVFAANGNVLRSEIDGIIQVKSFLAGNPELRIGLNEEIKIGRLEGGPTFYGSEIQLDDCSLHEKVDAEEFERSRTINIKPPDGEFIAMSYRITGEFNRQTPFRIHPFIEEVQNGKCIEVTLKLVCEILASHNATNVVVKVPVPRSTLSVSHDVSTGGQTVEYKSTEKVVYWCLKKMHGGTEQNTKLKINLSSQSISSRKEIGPVSLDFEIPMYVCSSLQVKFLKVFERNNLYVPMRWIRYITHSDSYIHRL